MERRVCRSSSRLDGSNKSTLASNSNQHHAIREPDRKLLKVRLKMLAGNPLMSFYEASSRDPAACQVMGGGQDTRQIVGAITPLKSPASDIQVQDIDRPRSCIPLFFPSFSRLFPPLSFLESSLSRRFSIFAEEAEEGTRTRSARVTRRGGRTGRLVSVSFVRSLRGA